MLQIKQTTNLITEKLFDWFTATINMLPNIGLAFILAIAFYFLAKLGRYAILKVTGKSTGSSLIMRLLGNIIFMIILTIGLFAALSAVKLDKTVTSLLAGAGIIGLALGLAFQETAANFLSGILIALRKPIDIDDIVETNDEIGIVRSLNLRSTILTDFQGQDVIIPNKNVLFNKIRNYSKTQNRRLDLELGVSYMEDLNKVRDVLLKSVENLNNLEPDKPKFVWFEAFGDSSINLTLAIWMKGADQPQFRTFKSDTIMAIKKAFDENNITIPFPIRTLDFGIKGEYDKLKELEGKGSTPNDDKNGNDSSSIDER